MWKKIQSLLFEEEDEIIEDSDDEVETKAVKEKTSVIAQMNPKLSNTKEERIVETVKEQLNEIDELEDILVEEKEEIVETRSFGISADSEKEKRPIQKQDEQTKKVYEFHPVISPMFGATVSKHPDSEPRIVQEAHATLPRSVINTVISPIYGDLEVKKQRDVDYEPLKEVHVHREAVKLSEPIEEVVHFDPIVEEVELSGRHIKVEEKQEKEEILETKKTVYNDLSLDDLLGANIEESVETKSENDDDDAHQFSLFDEN